MVSPLSYIFAFLFATVISFSCRKDMRKAADLPAKDFSQVFDRFWTGMNKNYVYWDIDTTDWNAVYTRYKPLFAQLDLNYLPDVQKSLFYFRQMTLGLLDGHFQIVFEALGVQGTILFPALQRKQASSSFHYPYNYHNIDTQYFDRDFWFISDSTLQPDQNPLNTTLATINNSILYFSCNKFSLMKYYLSSTNNKVKSLIDTFCFRLKEDTAIKGAIIDVRNNSGGNISDVNFLLGQFIDRPLHFGFSSYKNNSGRLDFTPWITSTIEPASHAKAFQYPIVVLVDNYTISAAEILAMAIRALPKSILVGEPTWGATGPLANNELYDAGQFSIPGILKVYTSSARFKYIDGKIYEAIGFLPDVLIPFNSQLISLGRDSQLEAAIAEFH